MNNNLLQFIKQKKQELNAVILAHYYQAPQIQDVADFVGDSLQLAREAAQTTADVIVSCGVSFMAETAKILSPDKMVLLPVPEAHCPMAEMVTVTALNEMKAQHPGAVVVCYVNTSAEVKAESDICCTSSNAVAIVNSIPRDKKIIFIPDRNLGYWVQSQTGREMILWEGYCPVHNEVARLEVEKLTKIHPRARVVVHPECPPEVTRMADAVCSTTGILEFVQCSPAQEFIIGTEEGVLHTLGKISPEKQFFLARSGFICPEMKTIDLSLLAQTMKKLETQVEIPENIRERALVALERMLSI